MAASNATKTNIERGEQRHVMLLLTNNSMADVVNGGCHDTVPTEGKTEAFQCQSLGLELSSGRVLFKGVNMAFLNVNGHQMFTLNEILEKLFPNTPRTTVCTRMDKINAFRHACTKEEIRKMKALGGAKPNAINCTLISRKHVVEYSEKFVQKEDGRRKKSLRKGNVVNTPNLKDQQRNDPASTESQVCNTNTVASDERVIKESGIVPNEDFRRGISEEPCKERTPVTGETAETQTNESCKEIGKSERQYPLFDEQNVRHSKLTNSVSWRSVGLISQLAGRAKGTIYEEGDRRTPKPNLSLINKQERISKNGFARKRKRKTDQEKFQARCSKNADDNYTLKRQKKAFKIKGKGTFTKKRSLLSVDESTIHPPSCYSDLTGFTSTSKQVDGKAFQTLNLEYLFNEECEPPKRYFDNNNNEVPLQPHSPTLLLKRSVNNEWHVAKTTLPSLSFDLEEQAESGSDKVDTSVPQATYKKTAIDLSQSIRFAEPPIQTLPETVKRLSAKEKKSGAVGRRFSSKKIGRLSPVNGKRRQAKVIKTCEQESKDNHLTDFPPDASAKGKTSSANFNLNRSDHSFKPATSGSTSSDASAKKLKKSGEVEETVHPTMIQETWNGLEKRKINKASDRVVKRTRRRRLRLNSFRLIETIPYPSLLTVKDGDLCPSQTMTYSSAKRIPGSCHPLWRWRLGEPVLVRRQSQIKSSLGEQRTIVHYDGPVGIKNDVSLKETTIG